MNDKMQPDNASLAKNAALEPILPLNVETFANVFCEHENACRVVAIASGDFEVARQKANNASALLVEARHKKDIAQQKLLSLLERRAADAGNEMPTDVVAAIVG